MRCLSSLERFNAVFTPLNNQLKLLVINLNEKNMETPIDATPATVPQPTPAETTPTQANTDAVTPPQSGLQQDSAPDLATPAVEPAVAESAASTQQVASQLAAPEIDGDPVPKNSDQNIEDKTTPEAGEIPKNVTQNSNPFAQLTPDQQMQIQHLIDIGIGTAMMQCQLTVAEVAGLEDALMIIGGLPETEQSARAFHVLQSLVEDAKLPPYARITRQEMAAFAQTYALNMRPLSDEEGYTLTLTPYIDEVENV